MEDPREYEHEEVPDYIGDLLQFVEGRHLWCPFTNWDDVPF